MRLKSCFFSQNDNYVEYARDGRILKGRERAYIKSKYEEDVLVGNHSSIWGSWFDANSGRWGFACCHQCMKNAYCIPIKKGDETAAEDGQEEGEVNESVAIEDGGDGATVAGGGGSEPSRGAREKVTGDADGDHKSSSGSDSSASDAESDNKKAKEEKRKKRLLEGIKLFGQEGAAAGTSEAAASSSAAVAGSSQAASSSSAPAESGSKLKDQRSSAFGHTLEDVSEFDKRRVDEAVEREKKRQKKEKKEAKGKLTLDDERNRKYNSLDGDSAGFELSPEEFEAYRLTKQRADDPMAKFL